MAKRTYDQPTCGLATALDLLGERWTLLIVRELMLGPQRYSDLQNALDGVSTNLLADRLRHLEDIDVIMRIHLPPPAASKVYELTALGRELEDVVIGLAKWGSRFSSEPCDQTFDPRRQAFALFARFDATAACDLDEMYEYRIGGHTLFAHVSRGRVTATPAIGRRSDCVIVTDAAAFTEMVEHGAELQDLVTCGRVEVLGDTTVARRSITLFR